MSEVLKESFTSLQTRFIDAYARTGVKLAAAAEAKQKDLESLSRSEKASLINWANRELQKLAVVNHIQQRKKDLAIVIEKRFDITLDEVLSRIYDIAVDETVRPQVRLNALVKLGEHLGGFVRKHEHDVNNNVNLVTYTLEIPDNSRVVKTVEAEEFDD